MPKIEIDQATLRRLKRHSDQRDDTFNGIINQALDLFEESEEPTRPPIPAPPYPIQEHRIDPLNIPNMSHTKLLYASINGRKIDNPNWNLLLRHMLGVALDSVLSLQDLRQQYSVNIVAGKIADKSYHFFQRRNFSLQNVDSNRACKAVVSIARNLRISLEVSLEWRDELDADRPGERGRLSIP